MSSDSNKLLTLDTAFIIAILTGILYVISFLYYAGQFYYYKIPLFLIEISIKNIINSMLHFSPLLITFFGSSIVIVLLLNKIKKAKQRKSNPEINQVSGQSRKNKKKTKGKFRLLRFLLVLYIVLVLLFIATILYLIKIKVLTYYVLLGVSTGFISSILIFSSILLYRRKSFFGSIVLVFIVLCGTSFFLGYGFASESNTYILVKDKNKTFVSLAVYNDQFVLSPINMKTKEFRNDLKLMEVKDVKEFKQMKMLIKLKK
ncbi:hypothetical protein [Bacillus sp. AFS031507]|uniref:hypothetical protein n=1 Tax=Bacillus sp. AFS031507 TaxID=2033496 RepID=UPI000BFD94E8|nr:hypothetical protein [Bacillus sp. AFS031507]PGY10621.1 hypothetical protein COE25_12670 [Bacillus sp. AFS031507]